jgi:apolipoprotein D and lipocalin family protein
MRFRSLRRPWRELFPFMNTNLIPSHNQQSARLSGGFLRVFSGRLRHWWLLVMAGVGLAGCTTEHPPLRTVPHVDLSRYLGNWYVIANIPYSLEKGKVASYDTYAMRDDGRMDNTFTFRKDSLDAPEKSWHGVAWVVNHESNAEWHVRFIWPLYSTYLVRELDPQYQWAVVGTPGHKLLWILCRQRQMDDATYADILKLIAAQGYDTSLLTKVPQPMGK